MGGMVSKIPYLSTNLAAIFWGVAFYFCVTSPRLGITIMAGTLSTFPIYFCLCLVQEHFYVVQWRDRFTINNYMATMAPALGLVNCGIYKLWCYGKIPFWLYVSGLPILQGVETIARAYKDEQSKF